MFFFNFFNIILHSLLSFCSTTCLFFKFFSVTFLFRIDLEDFIIYLTEHQTFAVVETYILSVWIEKFLTIFILRKFQECNNFQLQIKIDQTKLTIF